MKKLFILLTLVVFAFSANAQKVNSFWGTAADTLTASVAKTFVLPIGTNEFQDFTVAIFTDHVSGTDTYTAKIEYSLDMVNYHAILSAANETHAAGSDNSFVWTGRNAYSYAAAADDTTAGGTLRYYNIYVETPVLAKYIKVTLTPDATTQKSLCYGYYIIKKYNN